MHLGPKPWLAGSSTSTVTICPTTGGDNGALSPSQAIRIPPRLMFSVYIAPGSQSAGANTWQRSLMSTRGLSRRLIFSISDKRNLTCEVREYQCRIWAICRCFLRLLANVRGRSDNINRGNTAFLSFVGRRRSMRGIINYNILKLNQNVE